MGAELSEEQVAFAKVVRDFAEGEVAPHADAWDRDHANDRQAFGGPIGRNQAIAFKCADMSVLYESSAALTYRAAWLKDHGRPYRQEAAIAKLHATESAVSAAREATQIFGGAGFLDESPVARHWRDSKSLEIGEGTSEVQRIVISQGLGLPT